jgi:hypothetical protein
MARRGQKDQTGKQRDRNLILREKIAHFDHGRIPERVVHARGAGAYGHFQVYKSKPEPHHEIPQAASARLHSLMPESMHMIMWVMSDRAIPRGLRMMEGFVGEAYIHCTTIGATGEGAALLDAAGIGAGKGQTGQEDASAGVVVGRGGDIHGVAPEFIKAVAQRRHRERRD